MKKSTPSRRKVEKPRKRRAGGKEPAKKIAVTSGAGKRVDPHLSREQLKYEAPVPSRELILDTLVKQGVPVSDTKLQQLLHVTPSELEGFDRRLGAMQREGQIMRNRRGAICVVTKMDLITGTVQGHPDGFGFLLRDDAWLNLLFSSYN